MNPATTSAASGSRIGRPRRAPTSAAMTVADVQTSPRVCVASASRGPPPSLPARCVGSHTRGRAAEPLGFLRLVTDYPDVHEDRRDHDHEAGDADLVGY